MKKASTLNLSIALATYNEEFALSRCLESVEGLADEIMVVDGSSADKTVEVAKRFGAQVVITDNPPIFHINKQRAIDLCRGEWVLQLDADEIVTPELAQEIREVIKNQPVDRQPVAYRIKRKKMFLGRWIKKGGQYPDPVIRLFKQGKARLPCKSVHEQMEVDGEVGELKSHLLHLSSPDFATYIIKDNRYSTLTAKEMKTERVQINFLSGLNYFVVQPLKVFFTLFVRHRGYLDGFPGFVFALYSGLHLATAYVKYWEMKNGVPSHRSH